MAFLKGIGSIPLNEVIESLGGQMMRGSTVVVISAAEYPEIQLSLEILLRRKLRPIIIQINKASFMKDDEVFVNSIEPLNLPNVTINFGDDIASSLQSIIKY